MSNIIIIVLDAVRPDHIGCYNYQRNTTPNIDTVAEDGIRYQNAFSNSNWTGTSHAALFTGQLPSHSGVYGGRQTLPENRLTLGELVNQAGYDTFAMSAGTHIRGERGYNRGMDQFEEAYRIRPSKHYLSSMMRDWHAVKQTFITGVFGHDNYTLYKKNKLKQFIRRSDQPFFAFVNFKTAHHPYNPPRPYKSFYDDDLSRPPMEFFEQAISMLGREPQSHNSADIDRIREISQNYPIITDEISPTEEEIKIVQKWYDGAIRYLDKQVGEIIQLLERDNIKNNTTLIITSDHGDLFGEHGLEKHQYSLYDSLIRIPLIIDTANTGPQIHSEPVSLIDLYPTIRELIGESASSSTVASSLLPLEEETTHQYLYSEVDRKPVEPIRRRHPEFENSCYNGPVQSVRSDKYKLILYDNKDPELYNWQKDPSEKNNQYYNMRDTAEELRRKLNNTLNEMAEQSSVDDINDSRLRSQLEELGYL